MDNSLIEKFRPHWIPIFLGMAGVIFLIYGLITLIVPKEKGEMTFESASGSAQTEQSQASIMVDIQGSVEKPGVYQLPAEARVQDGLIAAGGMSKDADREKVSKGMNLAAKLTDGAKIYIPAVGESTPASSGQGTLGIQDSASGHININSASSSELDKLPGVGPATAEKIISNRPYATIEELVTKKAVGKKVFDNIKDSISVF